MADATPSGAMPMVKVKRLSMLSVGALRYVCGGGGGVNLYVASVAWRSLSCL